VKERLASASEVVLVPYDKAYEAGFEDMPRRIPDTRKIRDLLGFEPRTKLPEIIDLVAEHHRAGA
jgi:UDP-glucose 4-epimerase